MLQTEKKIEVFFPFDSLEKNWVLTNYKKRNNHKSLILCSIVNAKIKNEVTLKLIRNKKLKNE